MILLILKAKNSPEHQKQLEESSHALEEHFEGAYATKLGLTGKEPYCSLQLVRTWFAQTLAKPGCGSCFEQ